MSTTTREIALRSGMLASYFPGWTTRLLVRVVKIERAIGGDFIATVRVVRTGSSAYRVGELLSFDAERHDLIPCAAVRYLKSRGGKLSPRVFDIVADDSTTRSQVYRFYFPRGGVS